MTPEKQAHEMHSHEIVAECYRRPRKWGKINELPAESLNPCSRSRQTSGAIAALSRNFGAFPLQQLAIGRYLAKITRTGDCRYRR